MQKQKVNGFAITAGILFGLFALYEFFTSLDFYQYTFEYLFESFRFNFNSMRYLLVNISYILIPIGAIMLSILYFIQNKTFLLAVGYMLMSIRYLLQILFYGIDNLRLGVDQITSVVIDIFNILAIAVAVLIICICIYSKNPNTKRVMKNLWFIPGAIILLKTIINIITFVVFIIKDYSILYSTVSGASAGYGLLSMVQAQISPLLLIAAVTFGMLYITKQADQAPTINQPIYPQQNRPY